jgi:hypothetical protein
MAEEGGGASLETGSLNALRQVLDPRLIADAIVSLDEDTAVQVLATILQARPELAPPVINIAVPDLTYPPAKSVQERRAKGVIKGFNPETGVGAIECQELYAVFGQDVILMPQQAAGLAHGTPVSFAVVLTADNMPQAYDVKMLEPGKGGAGTGVLATMPALGDPGVVGGMPSIGQPNVPCVDGAAATAVPAMDFDPVQAVMSGKTGAEVAMMMGAMMKGMKAPQMAKGKGPEGY